MSVEELLRKQGELDAVVAREIAFLKRKLNVMLLVLDDVYFKREGKKLWCPACPNDQLHPRFYTSLTELILHYGAVHCY